MATTPKNNSLAMAMSVKKSTGKKYPTGPWTDEPLEDFSSIASAIIAKRAKIQNTGEEPSDVTLDELNEDAALKENYSDSEIEDVTPSGTSMASKIRARMQQRKTR